MNWGTAIVIFFSFFAISMVSAVIATTRHPPQMVQKDYYALDLNYQAHLEKKQRTAALPVLPTVHYAAEKGAVEVVFPEDMQVRDGQIKCYRSVTTRDDVTIPLSNSSAYSIPAAHFAAGRWRVELDWTDAQGNAYFWETFFVK